MLFSSRASVEKDIRTCMVTVLPPLSGAKYYASHFWGKHAVANGPNIFQMLLVHSGRETLLIHTQSTILTPPRLACRHPCVTACSLCRRVTLKLSYSVCMPLTKPHQGADKTLSRSSARPVARTIATDAKLYGCVIIIIIVVVIIAWLVQ